LTGKIQSLTNGVNTSGSVAGGSTRHKNTSAKFRIGSTSGNTGQSDISQVGFYNRALSDSEITSTYTYLKSVMARKGITI
jgi:hypothetical protein